MMTWTYGLIDFNLKATVQSDGRCVRTYMRKYLVQCSGAGSLQPESAVLNAVGIVRGSPIGEDPNAICNDVDISPAVMSRGPNYFYIATYTFSTAATLPASTGGAEPSDDPVDMRTVWSVSPQIQSRYVIKDRHGELIVNTAGQPYDGGIPVDVRLGSVTARRNVDATGYNLSGVLKNSGKLNSVTFLGWAPGTVQVDISAVEKYEGAYHYWEETFTFSYDPQGWQPQPASAGFFQLVGGDLKRIVNSDLGDDNPDTMDQPVQEPEPLDDNGALVPVAARPAGCSFVTVDYFDDESLDFASFNL